MTWVQLKKKKKNKKLKNGVEKRTFCYLGQTDLILKPSRVACALISPILQFRHLPVKLKS